MHKYLCIVQDGKRGHTETMLTVALSKLTLKGVVQLIGLQERSIGNVVRTAKEIEELAKPYACEEIKGEVLSIMADNGSQRDRYDTYPFAYRYLIARIPE